MANKLLLVILDGWGHSESIDNNAIAKASTPTWDYLLNTYPSTLLQCSGVAVGLPEGQIGNSEVGHMHIGAGRVIPQALSRLNTSINAGLFDQHPALLKAKQFSSDLHIIGLVSDGGVHSLQSHMQKLVQSLAKFKGKIWIHAILDGRDSPPKSANQYLDKLQQCLPENAYIASICGRYFAMDRDNNWQRTRRAYAALMAKETRFTSWELALQAAYDMDSTDEFVNPSVCHPAYSGIKDNDSIIFTNFRADRMRQLSSIFLDSSFSNFPVDSIKLQACITMTSYNPALSCPNLLPSLTANNTIGEIVAKHKLKQLRIAETEKYAHVTYFFNAGEELAFALEDRMLIPSPAVTTYDLQPSMSATELTKSLLDNLANYDFMVCNYANADMVGHTGNFDATVAAIECLDRCLAELYTACNQLGITIMITADHGNAEHMYDTSTNQAYTAHTTNLVPCVVTNQNMQPLHPTGSLIDIAPSALRIMGLTIPDSMQGKILFQ